MHWNVSIILALKNGLFSAVFYTRREKNTSNLAATVGDVMDDVTCKCSIATRFSSFMNPVALYE
jgi:hypothetical protein